MYTMRMRSLPEYLGSQLGSQTAPLPAKVLGALPTS